MLIVELFQEQLPHLDLSDDKVDVTQSVVQVVLQKSIPTQIHQLVRYLADDKVDAAHGLVDDLARHRVDVLQRDTSFRNTPPVGPFSSPMPLAATTSPANAEDV